MENNPYYVQRANPLGSLFQGAQQGAGLVAQYRKMLSDKQNMETQQAMEAEKLKQAQFEGSNSLGATDASLGFPTAGQPLASGMQGPSAPVAVPNRTAIPWMQSQQARQDASKERQMNRDIAGQGKTVGYANQFRDEFNQLSKPFQTIVPMYKNIVSAATLPDAQATPQTDMSMIFAYMKLLDPNSTVREGEYATAQNAGSIPDSIRNQFNRLKDGDKLQPQQRIQFARSAQNVFKSASDIQGQHISRYTDLSKRGGVDPQNVIFDYGAGLGGETFGAPEAIQPGIRKDKNGVIYID